MTRFAVTFTNKPGTHYYRGRTASTLSEYLLERLGLRVETITPAPRDPLPY